MWVRVGPCGSVYPLITISNSYVINLIGSVWVRVRPCGSVWVRVGPCGSVWVRVVRVVRVMRVMRVVRVGPCRSVIGP